MDNLQIFLTFISTLVLFQGCVNSSDALKKYVVLENENLLVRCNVTNHPDLFVYWSKNDPKQYFRQNGTDLMIFNIKRVYAGDYICHALNTSYPEYTISVIKVDVQYPAEIGFFDVSPQSVMENETFLLMCNVAGNPNPTWEIINRDTGKTLVQLNVAENTTIGPVKARCDSAGFLEATAYNRLNKGVNATKGYNLTVLCSPRPVYDQKWYFETILGADAKIDVNLLAYPRPNYTWVRSDGLPVTGGIQTDEDHSTELEFQNVELHQLGHYVLTMSNEYGVYRSNYTLAANGPPQTPSHLTYSDVTYDSVTLRWTSGFNMGSQQYFMVMRLFDGNAFSQLSERIYDNATSNGVNVTWTYILRGLASSRFYNVSIVSENLNNFMSGFSKPVHFNTQSYPIPSQKSNNNLGLILGLTLGTVGIIGTLSCLVYIFKWKHMRTSYSTVK